MTIELVIAVVIYFVVASRLCGGGLFANRLTKILDFLPEVLFAIPFAFIAPLAFGVSTFTVCLGVLSAAAAGLGMRSGTWPLLPWELKGIRYRSDRSATLLTVANYLADKLGIVRDSERFAWLYGAVKGFVVGNVTFTFYGISTALAYETGSHLRYKVKDHIAASEMLLGFYTAIGYLVMLGVIL